MLCDKCGVKSDFTLIVTNWNSREGGHVSPQVERWCVLCVRGQ